MTGIVGSGKIIPSNPVLPCTCSAVTRFRISGFSQPLKIEIPSILASSQTILAFLTVRFKGTFPATVVKPKRLISLGDAKANKIATASSWPGSVSMITFSYIIVC